MHMSEMEVSDTRLPWQYPCQVFSQHSSCAMNSEDPTAACELDSQRHHQDILSNNVNRVLELKLGLLFLQLHH